jgi:hypothetical protein
MISQSVVSRTDKSPGAKPAVMGDENPCDSTRCRMREKRRQIKIVGGINRYSLPPIPILIPLPPVFSQLLNWPLRACCPGKLQDWKCKTIVGFGRTCRMIAGEFGRITPFIHA